MRGLKRAITPSIDESLRPMRGCNNATRPLFPSVIDHLRRRRCVLPTETQRDGERKEGGRDREKEGDREIERELGREKGRNDNRERGSRKGRRRVLEG